MTEWKHRRGWTPPVFNDGNGPSRSTRRYEMTAYLILLLPIIMYVGITVNIYVIYVIRK